MTHLADPERIHQARRASEREVRVIAEFDELRRRFDGTTAAPASELPCSPTELAEIILRRRVEAQTPKDRRWWQAAYLDLTAFVPDERADHIRGYESLRGRLKQRAALARRFRALTADQQEVWRLGQVALDELGPRRRREVDEAFGAFLDEEAGRLGILHFLYEEPIGRALKDLEDDARELADLRDPGPLGRLSFLAHPLALGPWAAVVTGIVLVAGGSGLLSALIAVIVGSILGFVVMFMLWAMGEFFERRKLEHVLGILIVGLPIAAGAGATLLVNFVLGLLLSAVSAVSAVSALSAVITGIAVIVGIILGFVVTFVLGMVLSRTPERGKLKHVARIVFVGLSVAAGAGAALLVNFVLGLLVSR